MFSYYSSNCCLKYSQKMKAVGSVANKRCTVERSICLFFSCETETIKRKTKLEIRIVQEGKKFLHFLGFFSSSFAGSVFYKKHSRKTKPNHSSFLFTLEELWEHLTVALELIIIFVVGPGPMDHNGLLMLLCWGTNRGW